MSQSNVESTEAVIEAHQESSALRVDGDTAAGCLHIPSYASNKSPYFLHQPYTDKPNSESCNTETYSVQCPTQSEQLPGVATPHHSQPPNKFSHPSLHSTSDCNLAHNPGLSNETHHKITQASVPFTAESSSASNSMLEMSPHDQAKSEWQFSSNTSSSNVSQENILDSSRSDIMEPKFYPVQHHQSRLSQPTLVRGLHNQPRKWYQTSFASLPPLEYEQQHYGIPEDAAMYPPSLQPVIRTPMNRSMSQDYHYQPRQAHNLGEQRLRRYTLAPYHFQYGMPFDPRFTTNYPQANTFGITPEKPQHVEYGMHYQGPHYGQFGDEDYRLAAEYTTMGRATTPSVPYYGFPSKAYAPIEQMPTMSSDVTGAARKGWGSDKYGEKSSNKISNIERGRMQPKQAHLSPTINAVSESSTQDDQPEALDTELDPNLYATGEGVTKRLSRNFDSEEMITNRMVMSQPEYHNNYYSTSIIHKSVPSPDTSSNTSIKRVPNKHMSRSSSAGIASIKNTSEHNLGSATTLTGSFSQSSLSLPPPRS